MDQSGQAGNGKKRAALTLIAIIFSGACWYLSCGLTGNFWYLLWIAPVPVLLISFKTGKWQTFFIAFISYLIGRLSWFPYLVTVIPLTIAIAFTLILPLIFAIVVLITRRVALTIPHWPAAFAFPVLWTAFEFAVFCLSRDGTIASLAYSQSNFLPVVQIASVIGIQGITFIVTFIPSAIDVAIFYKRNGKKITALGAVAASLLIIVLAFGIIRIQQDYPAKKLTAGLVCMDEKIHGDISEPDPKKEIAVASVYLNETASLAAKGAQVIVLPEKCINVNDSTEMITRQMFEDTAKRYHIMIVAGIAKAKSGYYTNNAWVISGNGKLAADYQKVNLFEGEALEGFRPGKGIGLVNGANGKDGIAICKDLDFQSFMMGYGQQKIAVLFAPAWDFVKDGWLHSRMGILRGVEGGYAIVRNAREGRLTISDNRGKVLYEASSENKRRAILLGDVPIKSANTIYNETGNWFSWLVVAAALIFIFYRPAKKPSRLV